MAQPCAPYSEPISRGPVAESIYYLRSQSAADGDGRFRAYSFHAADGKLVLAAALLKIHIEDRYR